MAQSKIQNIVDKNKPLIIRKGYNFSFSVGGNATQWINVTAPVEPGYTYIGIWGVDSGINGYRVYFPTFNEYGVRVTNPTNSAYSGTGYLTAGYIRDDLIF